MRKQLKKSESNIKLIPTKNPKRFTVQLDLPSERRYIGYINRAGDGYYVTERKKEHLYRRYNSYGVSYDLIHNSNIEFEWIIIKCEGEEYLSTRDYFKHKGRITNFTKKGYELQLHVSLEQLNIKTIKEFERFTPHQFNLFGAGGDHANA